MYTEIKELINFLAVFMHHRIARRRISLCMESFANHLATRFHDNWRPDEPKHAQAERILAIKTRGGMDEMFIAVAASVGINGDDLYASFPTTIFIYCNPGEVTCRISDYPSIVIIWRGDVDADKFYIPTPIGAAKYYDGNSHNIQNTVLNAYVKQESMLRPAGHAKKRDVKPERCIPLTLVSSAEIDAYDLLATGFIDINEVPPVLFRYKRANSKQFTVRSFAATRFGSHRPRPDHKAMRRIQHAAAYLAITNANAIQQANVPLLENFPVNFQFAMGPEGGNGKCCGCKDLSLLFG
ncbi:hypothetical protein LOAG_08799 [Loa loa]|uniref:Anti-proliferative protein domain-containing protein n=1 Tax=Loa loa TaxID=7209 RepID=A0A1S0TST7_LOALO|nr:hypothetical protein LOAG_08799 [Loa loa]EFO19692.2 hypothetical protein LOAG_08799 [Loa loa]